jgi:hypothetical protein
VINGNCFKDDTGRRNEDIRLNRKGLSLSGPASEQFGIDLDLDPLFIPS